MLLWESSLAPYVSILPTSSPAILPMMLKIPNYTTSCHIAIYLPTSGLEAEFVSAMASLDACLEEIYLKYDPCPIFIRGDANSSQSNLKRAKLLKSFCEDLDLMRVEVDHCTYHHFTGHGASDSELDVLLFSNQRGVREKLLELHCQLLDPQIDSHHDLLLSLCSFPRKKQVPDISKNIVAPKIKNKRCKVFWSENGIAEYETITSRLLPDLRTRWMSSSSQALTSVLLQSTNFLLQQAASVSNKVVSLSSTTAPKSDRPPKCVKKSSNNLSKAHSKLKFIMADPTASETDMDAARCKLKCLRNRHRKLIRYLRLKENIRRDSKLGQIITDVEKNSLYNNVRKIRSKAVSHVQKLHVGEKVYTGANVPDGFYDSILSLKKLDKAALDSSSSFLSASET